MRVIPILMSGLFIMIMTSCNQSGERIKNKEQVGKDKITESISMTPVQSDTILENIGAKVPGNELKGRWQRSDGDYILEVLSVNANGKAVVAYSNPGTINVESAACMIKDNNLNLTVVLRDVNYPGSTYTLAYYPSEDLLAGKYFQAIDKINYDVIFYRKK